MSPDSPVKIVALPCPKCDAPEGRLFTVATHGPGQFMFGYRCDACLPA